MFKGILHDGAFEMYNLKLNVLFKRSCGLWAYWAVTNSGTLVQMRRIRDLVAIITFIMKSN